MYDILFVGVGRVGGLALDIFFKLYSPLEIKVAVADIDEKRLAEIRSIYGGLVDAFKVSSVNDIVDIARRSYIVATALPSNIALEIIEKILRKGVNVVDVSFIPEDPYSLRNIVEEKKVFYVVDAGFAPGFSNLVVGTIYAKLNDVLDSVRIYVGGLPVENIPPIGYQVTWNPEDLIEEYTRPARIIRNNSLASIDPLEEILEVEIPGIGIFEGFYSDGLRTLLRNVRAKEMYEITIRHKGHLRFIKVLRELGFFDKKPIVVNKCSIKPSKFTAELFSRKLRPSIPDMAILYIDIKKNNLFYRLTSKLVGEPSKPATAYYTALVYAKTISIAYENELEPGIYPLEKLYRYYSEYLSFLKENNVCITVSSNISVL